MDPKERDQQLDNWLDKALEQYGEAEPQWGFEQRVLARVQAEVQSPEQMEDRSRWRSAKFWLPALAVVAVAVAVAVLLTTQGTRKTDAPGTNPTVANESAPAKIAPPVVQGPSSRNTTARFAAPKSSTRRHGKESVEQFPRLAAFPTPTPITGEERALMAFVRRTPREAERVAKAQQEQPEAQQKLTIQALKIEPLEAAAFGGETK